MKEIFKKAGVLLMAALLVAGLVLSCDDGSSNTSSSKTYTVTFDKGVGTSEASPKTATTPKGGGTVSLPTTNPAAPTGKVFQEWNTKSDGTGTTFTAATNVTSNITVYAIFKDNLSSSCALSGVTVAGVSPSPNSSYADTWAGVQTTGVISLSGSQKTDAEIKFSISTNATVEGGKITDDTNPTFGTIASGAKLTFSNGDILGFKVTAQDGIAVRYYKYTLKIGLNAELKEVWIGKEVNEDGTTGTSGSLGTAKDTWGTFANDERGELDVQEILESNSQTPIKIVPADTGATIQYDVLVVTNNQESTLSWKDYTATTTAVFGGETYLAIKVQSAEKEGDNYVYKYYRIAVNTKNGTDITYGQPKIWQDNDPTKVGTPYVDTLWDSVDWLDISRVNKAESYATWFGTDYGQHTSGKAKALWDDDGIYVYFVATFKDYKTSANQATATVRTASRSGDAAAWESGHGTDITDSSNTTPGDDHLKDSLEVFINERYETFKSGNYGNQYRSGVINEDGKTIFLSGDWPSDVGDNSNNQQDDFYNNLTKFQLDYKVNSWVTKDGSGKETGYVIIMHVPFVKYYMENISQVFNAAGNVKEGAQVGFELQINACATGTRDGILTWNGVTGQSYHNVRNYGIATLIGRP